MYTKVSHKQYWILFDNKVNEKYCLNKGKLDS